MKEVLRWIPVLHMAVPHRAVNPDQYKGVFPPAHPFLVTPGTRLFFFFFGLRAAPLLGPFFTMRTYLWNWRNSSPNVSSRETSPTADSGIFGFGRRACAGKGVALDTIWIAIASVLSVYNISKAVDSHGNKITPGQTTPRSCQPPCLIQMSHRAKVQGCFGAYSICWYGVDTYYSNRTKSDRKSVV